MLLQLDFFSLKDVVCYVPQTPSSYCERPATPRPGLGGGRGDCHAQGIAKIKACRSHIDWQDIKCFTWPSSLTLHEAQIVVLQGMCACVDVWHGVHRASSTIIIPLLIWYIAAYIAIILCPYPSCHLCSL